MSDRDPRPEGHLLAVILGAALGGLIAAAVLTRIIPRLRTGLSPRTVRMSEQSRFSGATDTRELRRGSTSGTR